MDTQTFLIIIIIVLLIGGGGWYGRGRWYSTILADSFMLPFAANRFSAMRAFLRW